MNNNNMEFCYETHKHVLETWSEGKPVAYWEEPDGIMCVRYESGNWWHYRRVSINSRYDKYGCYIPCLEWW